MEASRNVVDLTPNERDAFEGMLGTPLRDDQRVVVQLTEAELVKSKIPTLPRDNTVTIKREGDVGILPDWCAIFADLSDEEFAELEAAILTRADLSRSIDQDD
ncbi:MAG TPA: hypothetical protein VFW73_13590 [Lacipirellulaceae bacterium]|nr:hypothetical protein [Lacipirellulaceae bacterium]